MEIFPKERVTVAEDEQKNGAPTPFASSNYEDLQISIDDVSSKNNLSASQEASLDPMLQTYQNRGFFVSVVGSIFLFLFFCFVQF
jgi:hypothetical protein